MATYSNVGYINIAEVERSILAAGGGKSKKSNRDGSTHVSIYCKSRNWHLSYDIYPDGHYENVHTDRNNSGYMDYKGAY